MVLLCMCCDILLPNLSSAQNACTGSANCHVCKNCKYCKYCNSGGRCGVCQPAQKVKTPIKAKAIKSQAYKDYTVFNKASPDEDYINSYDVYVSDLMKHTFTHEMWNLVDSVVSLNKIDTNYQRTVRIYFYDKPSEGYYCYFQKPPHGESTIEY